VPSRQPSWAWTPVEAARPGGYRPAVRCVPLALALLLLALVMPATAPGAALRFEGLRGGWQTIPWPFDVDRVVIPVDVPAAGLAAERPADVGATDMTVELWVKGTVADNPAPAATCSAGVAADPIAWVFGNIALDRDAYGIGRSFGISFAGGRPLFGVVGAGGGSLTACGSAVALDGAWHHLAVTRRASDGRIDLFLDGAPQLPAGGVDGPDGPVDYPGGTAPLPNCSTPPGYTPAQSGVPCAMSPYLVLGAEKHDLSPLEYPGFRGLLDELRLSSVRRYGAPFARPGGAFGPDAQTAALYHFDEPGGSAVSDSSGAPGGPSPGELRVGGLPAGPARVADTPFGAGPEPPPAPPPAPAGATPPGPAGPVAASPGPGRLRLVVPVQSRAAALRRGVRVRLGGAPAGQRVRLTLRLPAAVARRLGLRSPRAGERTVIAGGDRLVRVGFTPRARRALTREPRSARGLTVEARTGGAAPVRVAVRLR
jgi:hypothetical protein